MTQRDDATTGDDFYDIYDDFTYDDLWEMHDSGEASCTACGAPYHNTLEPDATGVKCEECGANAVSTKLVQMGFI